MKEVTVTELKHKQEE